MSKIYNNLNIENLSKTDWFKQFDENQQKIIIVGLEDNLNVFIYAKKEFDWLQMEQIRWGIRDNLDVSKYANPKYTWKQMRHIRNNLL